jgi:hypothetical protein
MTVKAGGTYSCHWVLRVKEFADTKCMVLPSQKNALLIRVLLALG